ncbi:MAG TPA: hypothetical protein VJA18_05265 [Candidatus Nanoarchaeia archaeon]|nr:hypothetical protein [Candidatus Nanoarchaeia archaeon]
MQFYLPILFAFIIAITHYSINRLHNNCSRYHFEIISFSAGVSITYVLLDLFPNFTVAALSIHKLLFISLLLGFSAHHIIEKEIYQHKHRKKLVQDLSFQEEAFYFFDHLVLGFVLVSLFRQDIMGGMIAFLPILAFTIVSALRIKHSTRIKTAIAASATAIGVLLSLALGAIPEWLQVSLTGLASGLLLYTVIRHHIPFGREGRPFYFGLGFVLYSLFIIMTWYL